MPMEEASNILANVDFVSISNIIAVLLSPLIAVLVSRSLDDRRLSKERKYSIFITLISRRSKIVGSEKSVEALNSLDVVFAKNVKIRRLWKEYYDLLHQPETIGRWNEKYLELLKAIANEVGYKKEIDHLDLNRAYIPQWMSDSENKEGVSQDENTKTS